MKGRLFASMIACLIVTVAYAQINKLSGYDEIGWPSGFYAEGTNGTFLLEKDSDAIKLVTQVAETALSGKFNHRFTPSVNGEYTLKFKAKKDGLENQIISVNLLRTDAWTDLVSVKSEVSIDSVDFKEYVVTFEYREDIKTKTPQCYQLEIYVNGVLGNLWFKDIMLYENSNHQVTYVDDFETDLYYGLYQLNANSWNRTPTTAAERGELIKVKTGDNTVLQYTQQIGFTDPWNAAVTRKWWAQRDVQYRVQLDVSSSVNLPATGGIGLEVWDGTNKILPAEYFEVTSTMQTVDFITSKVAAEMAYDMVLFAGKLPAGEKLFVDNALIAPIYLYNATVVDVKENKVDIQWLHSGYLAEDKMDVSLIEGTNETVIKTDVEIVDGSVTLDLPVALDPEKQYKILLTDKVGSGDYTVHNSTESQKFIYVSTNIESHTTNKILVYVADGLLNVSNAPVGSVIKVYTITGHVINTSTTSNSTERIRIGKGVHIVQVNNNVFKVIM